MKLGHTRMGSFFRNIARTYCDFADATSIHGIKYTVHRERSVFERILWVLIVLSGLVASMFMLNLFWTRFTSNPTRTSVKTTYAPTTAIPFPAVTICNINEMLTSNIDSFVKKLDLHGLDEDYVKSIFPQLLAYSYEAEYNITDLHILQELLDANDFDSLKRVMKQTSQSCRDMLVKCRWELQVMECPELFVDVMTPYGRCCSFNYKPNDEPISYTYFFGYQRGLSVLLNPMPQEKQYSSIYSTGMKVIIHHARNYPGTRKIEKILAVGRETILQIDGTRYVCSEEVRSLTPSQRECVYSDEYVLAHYSEYREPNCMVECFSDHVLSNCKCVPYFYAAPGGGDMLFENIQCDCPMQCDDVFYNVISSSAQFIKTEYLTSSFLIDVNTTENSMLLHVYFSSQTQTILLRDTLTSTIYLLSSFGGIFSLFLGCSFISGAEIIYYIFIRFPINLRRPSQVSTKPTDIQKTFAKGQRPWANQVRHGQVNDNKLYAIYGKNVFLN